MRIRHLFVFGLLLAGCGVDLGPFLESEETAGVREALIVGSQNASETLSRTDAYYRSAFQIPFPAEARTVADTLERLGMQALVSNVVLSLNRAAEDAAIKAKPIFVEAVKEMTITDAIGIVRGRKDEATRYLRDKTHSKLVTAFRPSIASSLDKVNATRYWGQAMDFYNQIPFVEKVNPDLAAYVTGKALDGLFIVVAQEELKIRTDPAARVTEILKKVFGNAGRAPEGE